MTADLPPPEDMIRRLRDEVPGRTPVWRDRTEAADMIQRMVDVLDRIHAEVDPCDEVHVWCHEGLGRDVNHDRRQTRYCRYCYAGEQVGHTEWCPVTEIERLHDLIDVLDLPGGALRAAARKDQRTSHER